MCGKNNDKTSSLSHITVNSINKYRSSEICDEFAKYFSKKGANLATNTVTSVTNVDTYLSKIPKNKMSIFLVPCSSIEIKKIILGLKHKKKAVAMTKLTIFCYKNCVIA